MGFAFDPLFLANEVRIAATLFRLTVTALFSISLFLLTPFPPPVHPSTIRPCTRSVDVGSFGRRDTCELLRW